MHSAYAAENQRMYCLAALQPALAFTLTTPADRGRRWEMGREAINLF